MVSRTSPQPKAPKPGPRPAQGNWPPVAHIRGDQPSAIALIVDLVAFLAAIAAVITLVLFGRVDVAMLAGAAGFIIGIFRVFRSR